MKRDRLKWQTATLLAPVWKEKILSVISNRNNISSVSRLIFTAFYKVILQIKRSHLEVINGAFQLSDRLHEKYLYLSNFLCVNCLHLISCFIILSNIYHVTAGSSVFFFLEAIKRSKCFCLKAFKCLNIKWVIIQDENSIFLVICCIQRCKKKSIKTFGHARFETICKWRIINACILLSIRRASWVFGMPRTLLTAKII